MEITEQEMEAIYSTMSALEQRWLDGQPEIDRHHAYDPLPPTEFLPGWRVADKHAQGKHFLDIGCGIGTKLAFVHQLGYTVAGIERYKPYCAAAREMVPEAVITTGDAFDLTEFDADIVYMYRPMIRDEDELPLERHVISHLKAGSVLFLPARANSEACADLTQLASDVWKVA